MTCIREHPASPYPASMAGRVLESGVGWEAIYPRATGQAYEAEIRVGLYATEQEAQVRITRHPHMCSACNGCTHCSAVLAINSMSMHWRCGGRRQPAATPWQCRRPTWDTPAPAAAVLFIHRRTHDRNFAPLCFAALPAFASCRGWWTCCA